jgi:hypothetical protein
MWMRNLQISSFRIYYSVLVIKNLIRYLYFECEWLCWHLLQNKMQDDNAEMSQTYISLDIRSGAGICK